MPIDRSAVALLLFNLGVEAGQLAVLAVAVPIVLRLRSLPRMRSWAIPALSGCLAMIGLVWAVSRTLSAQTASASALGAASSAVAVSESSPLANGSPSEAPEPPPHSTYPREAGVPMAWVGPLCSSFHELPRARRAECAGGKPGGVQFTGECVRMLNVAVASGAIRLEPSSAERCMTAQQARYSDCGFTAARSLPALPVCSALWQGTRGQGAICRSALECSKGLHCQGVSPLEAGTCREPSPPGTRCGQAVDPLAAYVPNTDADHSECAGACTRGRCE